MIRILSWGNQEIFRVASHYLDKRVGIKSDLGADFDRRVIYSLVNKEYSKGNDIVYEDWTAGPYDLIFLSISYKDCNETRERIFNQILKEKLFDKKSRFISFVDSESSVASDVKVGYSTWIQEQCSIQTGCKLGDGVVVWANSHVGHGSNVEDFAWITSNSTICSSCNIGKGAFIGANSVITPGVSIADHTFIGAGAIITRDTKPYEVYLEGRNNKISNKISTEII